MNDSLYDKRSIEDNSYYKESYVRYGRLNLEEMSFDDLSKELKRVDKEIKSIQDEIEDSKKSYPSYVIKERLENANWYKEKLSNEIQTRISKESVIYCESSDTIQDMIDNLERQYKKGIVDKDYYEKYSKRLKESIVRNKEREEQLKAEEEERQRREQNKPRIFKVFKKKLKDYKK